MSVFSEVNPETIAMGQYAPPVYNIPVIIGINGLAGAGKDTVANMVRLSLQKDHGLKVECFAFADNLKRAASVIFNVPLESFYDRKLKEENISYWNMSPRQMAQQLGTEACRKGIRDDIWIKSLQSTILTSGVDIAFVTDVRFDNEALFVKHQNGVVIRVVREGQAKIITSDHASEQPLEPENVTQVINNVEGNTFVAASELQAVVLRILRNRASE
ncbi:deoxynucleoside monophosphate kinase [Xanthomonas phage Xoo-sp13]|nr:deoxynucleoside monophosphate kinase [Xanthomonas phage Xoo-sp13]